MGVKRRAVMDHGDSGLAQGPFPVTDTCIAQFAPESVLYRGYEVRDLVRESTFTEVAYLLLYGELPDEEFFADFLALLAEADEIPTAVSGLLDQLPLHASLREVLRTAISAMAHFDPQPGDQSVSANRSRAMRLLMQVPLLVTSRFRSMRGLTPTELDPARSYPAQLVTLVTGEVPSPQLEKAIDVLLLSSIDADFSPAVRAARLAVSAGADLYGAVLAASVVDSTSGRVDLAEAVIASWEEAAWSDDAANWVRSQLSEGQAMPGMVSLLEGTPDPRGVLLRPWTERLAAESGQLSLEAAAAEVEHAAGILGWAPCWEWSAIRLLTAAGFEPELALPLLTVSRILGWSAHVLEQLQQPAGPSPPSRYVGPSFREFPPPALRD